MLVPKLRFKREDGASYPEWGKESLSAVCDIVGGGTPSTEHKEYWNGSIQWFTPSEIGKSKYVSKSERTISQIGFEKSSARKLPVGTLLLTSRATLGEMSIATEECTTNQGFQSLIPQNIYGEYIYYLKPIIKRYCNKKACGSTFNEISKSELGKCIIPVPCPEEQQKIADFLSTVDEVISYSEAEVQNLEQQKKAAMQKIFSQEVRFKREDGTVFPEWEEKILQDVSHYITITGTGVKSVYVGTENMQKGCAGVCFDCDDDIAVKGIQYVPDDILISSIRPYLKKAWKADRNGICSTDVLCIRGTSEISSDFLYTLLSSDSFFEYVMQGVKGTKMPRGDKKHIMEMSVFIPCLEEQQKIADFLSAYDEAISYAKQELEHWKQLKKGLLQQMFI